MQVIRVIKKFAQILSSHQKKRVLQLSLLMIFGGFLEMLSVSLIMPYMQVVMNPEDTMSKWYIKMICRTFHIRSNTSFLMLLSFFLAFVYIAKNIYLLLEFNYQHKFVYRNMFMLQSRLLDAFLHRPYEYYLGVDSGEIVRIISFDTQSAFDLLQTLLTLATEMVVSAILITTVFIISPVITFWIVIVLATLVLVINTFLKPVLRKIGELNQKASAGMNKWLLQAIQGMKEIIVMRCEPYFRYNFDKYGFEKVAYTRRYAVLSNIPRFLIEACSMSAMFGIVGIMIYQGASIEKMIPVLTAVAMAALRLLPSANRISNALASISYNESMLDKLIENLTEIQGNKCLDTEPAQQKTKENHQKIQKIKNLTDKIHLKDITYRYPAGEKNVLYNVNLTIHAGESIGLIGMTGAGKTTVVDVILGLLSPDAGYVFVDGTDINEDMSGWLSQIGYIPQMIFMLDDSIRNNVAFGMDPDHYSDEQVWKALRDASMEEFVKSLPDGLNTRIGERGIRLSGGQRQRIGIARALFLNPSVLIFDEATSALDNETENAIMESIHHLHGRKTMITIAHRLTTIEHCDHVYKVRKGKVDKVR